MPIGQASYKPRGRKPRKVPRWARKPKWLWGFDVLAWAEGGAGADQVDGRSPLERGVNADTPEITVMYQAGNAGLAL